MSNGEFKVSESTQFKVNELIIVTKNDRLDVTSMFEELNIYDSLFMSVMSGRLLLKDSIGLSSKLLYDGSETLLIDIVKDPNSDVGRFKKSFRIYKQYDRTNNNMTSEMYTLAFVSDELVFSDQKRVNQAYENTYTEIVKKILSDYLQIPSNQSGGIYDETVGVRKIVVPNLRPLDAIEWCAKRSTDPKMSPNFLFFQNVTGYNFASLSNLLVNPVVLNIKFEPKNLMKKTPFDEICSARSLEVVNQVDAVERTRAGVNAGKFIGFDPVTRTIATKQISYDDHYRPMKHANPNPNLSVIENREKKKNIEMFDSKKTVAGFAYPQKYSNYIKKYDPSSIPKLDNVEDYLFQRRAILKNLTERRIRIVMPGNFQLSSGFNVQLDVSEFARNIKGDDNTDRTLSGKYIIVGTRHIIGFEKHETVIEVATTSTINEFIPVGPYIKETKELLEY